MGYRGKYIIGVTGPIGAGKSTVLRILRDLGAEVIDADRVAHEVMEPGGAAYQRVVTEFGPQILAGDGRIDRKRLADIVFSDREALKRLEGIVHPAVFQAVKERIAHTDRPVVALEAIKLLEAGLSLRLCDEVWVVVAEEAVQMARLRKRGLSEQEARRRLAAQLPRSEYERRADVIIDNSGSLDDLRRQVEVAWQRLVERVNPARGRPRTKGPSGRG